MLIFLISGFWNESSLSKQGLMNRRNIPELNTVARVVWEEIKEGKNNCTMEQAGRALIGVYSKNQIERDVISGIFKKMDAEMSPLKRLLESKIEGYSKGYMARELSFLWRLFEALRFCHASDFHREHSYFEPACVTFLVDRLCFLSSIWKQNDYLFCVKSVCVEWLLSEKPESHKSYAAITYNEELKGGLASINQLIVDIIKSYSSNSEERIGNLMSNITSENSTKVDLIEKDFKNWLFFTICMLNLNDQADSESVQKVLDFGGIYAYSPISSNEQLISGFKSEATLQEKLNNISESLAVIGNQLVIIELKEEIKSKVEVPDYAILVSYESWADQGSVFKILFPDNDDSKVSKKHKKDECSSSARGKGAEGKEAVAKGKGAEIDWETMITDFPLHGIPLHGSPQHGKGKGKKISPYYYK